MMTRKPRFRPGIALILFLTVAAAGPAASQCILANPSFEIAGSGGPVFGGWNQFGVVGSVAEASHGSVAARVTGPNSGDWGVSGFWQAQDSTEGEQWDVTGQVRVSGDKPLSGGSAAIVNIEWWDAGGALIDYQSAVVALPSTETDDYLDFAYTSHPAPAGTVEIHLLLGVLQGPTDPSPDIFYDQVTLYSTTAPTIDEVQWNDFPGGNTVDFGGQTWRVKGPGYYGPGSNLFCDDAGCVWVDTEGRLHMKFQKRGGNWYASEVTTEAALGYGDYILTTVGRLDLIDPQLVMGIFLWEYGPCWSDGYLWWNAFNEIDIEYSRWGDPAREIGQFVAQPYNWPGNIDHFDYTFGEDEVVSHAMRWLHDRVEYRVWQGGPNDESPATLIHAWTYTGPHIPRPEQPRMHLNIWRFDGTPAGDQEIIYQDFVFVPDGDVSPVEDIPGGRIVGAPGGRLFPAAPNPFNPRTEVRFEVVREGSVELEVFDLNGRRVRSLASGHFAAGEYHATWNGRSDRGRPLASGPYLFRLRGRDFVETQRVMLLK